MSENNFIDDNYVAPSSGGGYTKIESGENRFRILSSPLMTWNVWSDGKITRFPYNAENKPSKPDGLNASVKHAWNMIVYNYGTKSIEIMELDKMTVITPLLNHSKDVDWGHPKHYDIVVTKSGSGKDGTSYALIAKPKKPVSDEVKQAYFENPIDLSEMLKDGGNPFLSSPQSATPAKDPEPVKQEIKEAVKTDANTKPPF